MPDRNVRPTEMPNRLEIVVSAIDRGARAVLAGTAGDVRTLTRRVEELSVRSEAYSRIGRVQTGVALGVAGALGAASQQAMKYDQDLRNVNTISKLNEEGFRAMHEAVLDIARDPKVTDLPGTLSAGLYDIQSRGFKGAEGMGVLEVASKGAAAGLTTTDTAAKVLTATMMAYGKTTKSEAVEVMDQLFQLVQLAAPTFGEIANDYADAAVAAGQLGVPLSELNAAYATMTNKGHSAALANIALTRLMTTFMDPNKQLLAVMKAQGYESGMQIIKTKGLAGAVEWLTQATGNDQAEMVRLLGEMRAVRAIMSLTGEGADQFAQNLKEQATYAGAFNEALEEQSKGSMFAWRVMIKDLAIAAIEFGKEALPVVTAGLKAATGFLRAFGALPPGAKKLIVWIGAIGAGVLGVHGAVNLARGAILRYISDWMRLKGVMAGAAAAEGAAGVVGGAAEGAGGLGRGLLGRLFGGAAKRARVVPLGPEPANMPFLQDLFSAGGWGALSRAEQETLLGRAMGERAAQAAASSAARALGREAVARALIGPLGFAVGGALTAVFGTMAIARHMRAKWEQEGQDLSRSIADGVYKSSAAVEAVSSHIESAIRAGQLKGAEFENLGADLAESMKKGFDVGANLMIGLSEQRMKSARLKAEAVAETDPAAKREKFKAYYESRETEIKLQMEAERQANLKTPVWKLGEQRAAGKRWKDLEKDLATATANRLRNQMAIEGAARTERVKELRGGVASSGSAQVIAGLASNTTGTAVPQVGEYGLEETALQAARRQAYMDYQRTQGGVGGAQEYLQYVQEQAAAAMREAQATNDKAKIAEEQEKWAREIADAERDVWEAKQQEAKDAQGLNAETQSTRSTAGGGWKTQGGLRGMGASRTGMSGPQDMMIAPEEAGWGYGIGGNAGGRTGMSAPQSTQVMRAGGDEYGLVMYLTIKANTAAEIKELVGVEIDKAFA